jgi:SAM-dependent methyltransferase
MNDSKPMSAPATQLVAAGAASLLVELTILRYLPGQIRVLGYFTNFVLLAAFVGLGVGILGARRWATVAERITWAAPLGLLALVGFAILGRGYRVGGSGAEVLFLEYQTRMTRIPLFPFLGLSYVLIAAAFVPIGVWVGRTLAGPDPLRRYALNVVGSLAGIGVFVAFSASGAPPWLWFAFGGGSLLFALGAAPWPVRAGSLALVLASVLGARSGTADAVWSPYQKITTAPLSVHPKLGLVQEWQLPRMTDAERATISTLPLESGFTVRVNDDSYQTAIDLRDAFIKEHPALAPMRLQYDLPYMARPPGRVLVLGAGTGNDVAAALRMGATQVDAVEIDGEILALGARHPERPYADPRVRAHLTDARTFLAQGSFQRYDTIVYGLLDSHVLLSSMSNVRLDSYVFTAESFALAKGRLAPGGILIVSHAVGTDWFVERMRATLTEAFGRPPTLVSETVRHPVGFVYASGDLVPEGKPAAVGTVLLTDDWPFVYLRDRSIPREYLIAMALMAFASIAMVRIVTGAGFRGFDLHFFALGGGFLLIETRGLAVLALVAGSTWSVTSMVFAGVLTMALASTALGARLQRASPAGIAPRTMTLIYGLLGAALALQFAINISDLSELPLLARTVIGVVIVSLPMLASGIVFATSLARAGEADRALASNLVGAVAGGLIEYLSMVVGFRMLVLVALAFYALAFVSKKTPAPA